MHTGELFPPRTLSGTRVVNFLVGTKSGEDGRKAYLVELDPSYLCRVGDLLEATDEHTKKKYLFLVSDIDPAYSHKEEHAEMLDLLRRRPDKEIDDSTFRALCKNMAICTLMGEIAGDEIVEYGYRPNKYTTTATAADRKVEQLLTNDWQDGVALGHLRLGRETRSELAVKFATTALVGSRFLIVGQTGRGKSTAMRQLLDGHLRLMALNASARRVGFLVDDFKMEYPFDIHNQRKETVPGLVTKLGDIAKEKLVILTCRPERYSDSVDQVRDILRLQIPLANLSLSVFCELAELSPAQTNVVRLVEDAGRTTSDAFFDDLFATDNHNMPDTLLWGKKYGSIFYSDKGRRKTRENKPLDSEEDIDQNLRDRLSYIRRAARRLEQMPFVTRRSSDGDCLTTLLDYLADGCTVIVDKDGLEDYQREMLTIMLLFHLFRHNQTLAAGSDEQRNKMIPVVVAVEEAQYLLSKDKVADPDSIFAKIAFTGRSYQIGLLAITQRPQAIQKELLGQFDGFLVLPMEHINDFRHLADACPALAGYREDLATAPVGGGVLAYGSPKRVVSVKIDNYILPSNPITSNTTLPSKHDDGQRTLSGSRRRNGHTTS